MASWQEALTVVTVDMSPAEQLIRAHALQKAKVKQIEAALKGQATDATVVAAHIVFLEPIVGAVRSVTSSDSIVKTCQPEALYLLEVASDRQISAIISSGLSADSFAVLRAAREADTLDLLLVEQLPTVTRASTSSIGAYAGHPASIDGHNTFSPAAIGAYVGGATKTTGFGPNSIRGLAARVCDSHWVSDFLPQRATRPHACDMLTVSS